MTAVGVVQAEELRNISDLFKRQDEKYQKNRSNFLGLLSLLFFNRRVSILADKLKKSWPNLAEEAQREAVSLAADLLEKFGIGSTYNDVDTYSKRNDSFTNLVVQTCALVSRATPVHPDLPSRLDNEKVFAYAVFTSFLLSAAKFSETVLDLNDEHVFTPDISQEELDHLLTLNKQT